MANHAKTKRNYVTVEEALSVIKTGDRVFIHGSAATPVPLVKAMQVRHKDLHAVELVSITTMGDLDFDNPLWRESFFFNSLFVSANTRQVANSMNGDYVPIFLSQIPQLFKKNILPLDGGKQILFLFFMPQRSWDGGGERLVFQVRTVHRSKMFQAC